jgi:GntR family transcriptional regulator/MocR family aminotransferase
MMSWALGLALVAAGPAQAQTPSLEDGERLAGAALPETFGGATLRGTNSFGNPYRVALGANGTMTGVAGDADQYADSGRWWTEEDLFCRQWNEWLEARSECFVAVLDGDRIHWFREDGAFVTTESLSR